MGILEKYLTPENIENAPIDELFEIIKDKSHNRLTRELKPFPSKKLQLIPLVLR